MPGTTTIVRIVTLGALLLRAAAGQGDPSVILQIDIESWVQYIEDTSDLTKYATNSAVTPASTPRNFAAHVGIADIVAVNGQPVKGTMVRTIRNMNLSRTPNPGQAIGDAVRGATVVDVFEILTTGGDTIGTIITSGFAPGPPAPGAPLAVTQGNFAVIGGTGAFLGVRGQNGQSVNAQTVNVRAASITEDPANRRTNGGGKARWVMHLIPIERPEIALSGNGPAVTHSTDFTLVSTAKPAAPGESLSIFVTGLGPTRPGMDPGSPFPASAPAVTSPVAVTVNGNPAEVLGAAGYPGAVDGYQVNFRLPPDTPSGTAIIQMSSAWIAGAPVKIAIQ